MCLGMMPREVVEEYNRPPIKEPEELDVKWIVRHDGTEGSRALICGYFSDGRDIHFTTACIDLHKARQPTELLLQTMKELEQGLQALA